MSGGKKKDRGENRDGQGSGGTSTLVVWRLNVIVTGRVDVYGGRGVGETGPRPDGRQGGTLEDGCTPNVRGWLRSRDWTLG